MADQAAPVVLTAVTKSYGGLRPLRVQELRLEPRQRVALVGLDRAMAEVLMNLIMGASLPETGRVEVFGRDTAAIPDGDAWLGSLDQFGLLSERAVLVEQLTAAQNMALPFSLSVDPMPTEVRARVDRLAEEVGLPIAELDRSAGALGPAAQQRVRLARALALDPPLLLAEHPNAPLSPPDTQGFAADFVRVIRDRAMSALIVTADTVFAAAIADRTLVLQPATGVLKPSGGWRRWFS